MKLVFCDTSTEKLYLGIKNSSYSIQSIINTGFTHTENLALIFNFNLKLIKIEKIEDFDFIVLGRGPGSFTGIRIAYSFFKGIAVIDSIPFIEFNTLLLNFLSINEKKYNSLYVPLIFGKKNRYYGNIYYLSEAATINNFSAEFLEDNGIFDLDFDSILMHVNNYVDTLYHKFKKIPESINFYLNKKYHQNFDIAKIENTMKSKFSNKSINDINFNIYDFYINPDKILNFVSNNINHLNKKNITEIEPFYARKPDAELNQN